MSTVMLDGVCKSFGDVEVLHGIDIDVMDGEFVALVGPSGCGKSTLLRMIAGLEDVSDGDIYIDARRVNDLKPKDRNIAMVFQTYALYPQKTVRQNMGYALKLAGRPKAEIDKRVNEAASILALESLMERYPRQLSGGQRQRVAMGRAIVREPSVFLFDEPLSNLDAKLRVQMRSEIKELHQRLGATMLYVTHDQVEAMTMAHRVVVLHGGIVEQIGLPLELYDNPANLFVAGFIGSPAMNQLRGTISATDGRSQLETVGGQIPLPTVPSASLVGRDLVMGIRPEHLIMHDTAAPGRFPVRVAVVEPTGADTMVMARSGSMQITVLIRQRRSVRADDIVYLSFEEQEMHLFDPETGDALPAVCA